MDFLFGKKYPIFNKEGQVEHRREKPFEKWKQRYTSNQNKNWRYHCGLRFKDSKKTKNLS